MLYEEYKSAIQRHLEQNRAGATWPEMRRALTLPYDRPCPEWTRRLEGEIGLVRRKGEGRALVWYLQPRVTPSVAEGVRRIEEVVSGKVRGLTERAYRQAVGRR